MADRHAEAGRLVNSTSGAAGFGVVTDFVARSDIGAPGRGFMGWENDAGGLVNPTLLDRNKCVEKDGAREMWRTLPCLNARHGAPGLCCWVSIRGPGW